MIKSHRIKINLKLLYINFEKKIIIKGSLLAIVLEYLLDYLF